MRVIANVTAYYSKHDFPSHHYLCDFTVKGVKFSSMEQFMMYCKAMVFNDKKIAKEIMQTNNCQAQKMLGRDVKPYDEAVWEGWRRRVVFIGNREKYRQNHPLLLRLLETGDTLLVEASERDTLWGVGLKETDDRIADPKQWRGENLHGQIQMEVRAYFREHPEAKILMESTVDY
jgi:ribA/ribD-fused uncharacterized protein